MFKVNSKPKVKIIFFITALGIGLFFGLLIVQSWMQSSFDTRWKMIEKSEVQYVSIINEVSISRGFKLKEGNINKFCFLVHQPLFKTPLSAKIQISLFGLGKEIGQKNITFEKTTWFYDACVKLFPRPKLNDTIFEARIKISNPGNNPFYLGLKDGQLEDEHLSIDGIEKLGQSLVYWVEKPAEANPWQYFNTLLLRISQYKPYFLKYHTLFGIIVLQFLFAIGFFYSCLIQLASRKK